MDGGRGKFYAERMGRVPGIYESWEEAEPQVVGVKRAKHRSFYVYENALEYTGTGKGLSAGSSFGGTRLSQAGMGSEVRYSPVGDEGMEVPKSEVEWLLGLFCGSLQVGSTCLFRRMWRPEKGSRRMGSQRFSRSHQKVLKLLPMVPCWEMNALQGKRQPA
ncbi:hypothetical protein PIB30_088461 [Stylosanthes scabra]|uniref:Ribonuclease H1 N-terminal domain-containing protein n=1 Tax=Stylosanthes scabra TaxID=79078 RepID=A0ABU6QTQ8_9FABA|nr:hypothetical protein [Stylosanthes scabra]